MHEGDTMRLNHDTNGSNIAILALDGIRAGDWGEEKHIHTVYHNERYTKRQRCLRRIVNLYLS